MHKMMRLVSLSMALLFCAGAAEAAPRTYFMYLNAGTVLTQPPVTTNTTCPAASDTNLAAVSGIGLMADIDDLTCVPVANRDVRWTTAVPTFALHYNGAGYASAMNVTGTSVGVRVRSNTAGAILTANLFYTTPANTKVYFTGTPGTQVTTTTRTEYTISLAGLSATSVPAGSKIGVEFSWNSANGVRLSVNGSINSEKLIVDEVVALGPPTVATDAVTALSTTGATLNGTVSSNGASTTVTFDYGLTTGYGSTATAVQSPLAAGATGTVVSAAITGLTCGTLYHYRAKGVNSAGTTNGGDATFTTSACPTPPTVTTNAATALSTTGATLNGTVSSNGTSTTVTFDYGLTTGYGSTTTAAQSPLAVGAAGAAVSAAITGLTCNTLYHYRAKGVNGVGTTNGGDVAFTTSACPPVAACNTGTASGIVNTYYVGAASVSAGATSLTVGAASGAATTLAQGDLILIMQMQDAAIDTTNTASYGTASAVNAGKYEYATVDSVAGTTVNLTGPLANAYTAAAFGATGQKTFQVIRVPVYSSATLGAATAKAWDGVSGGVLAIDVTGTLTLAGATVDVSGLGFRGGASRTLAGGAGLNTDYLSLATINNNGSKGEGIAGTPRYVFTAPSTLTNTAVEGYFNGSHARGAPANAGGGGTDKTPVDNAQNPGGGGGANGGAGGLGGIGWCPTFNAAAPPLYGCVLNSGGLGGYAVAGLGATRLTMGGGGGGGTTNNGTGTPAAGLATSGSAGGGVVMLRAGTFSGSATINANGSPAINTVSNDGSGGGGAGGIVLLYAGAHPTGSVTINASGGAGGTNLIPPLSSGPHGPGGGGGGGYSLRSSAISAACAVTGGTNGVTYNNGVLFGAYGSTPGSNGSCGSTLTTAQMPGAAFGAGPCASNIHHFEIQHGTGTGLTCAASTLTIKACTDAAVPCATPYTGGVTGTLNKTGVPTVNWDGTTGGAAGADFVIANGNSSVTKNVQVATVGTVDFGITSSLPAPTSATTCNFGTPLCRFTASTAGFIFSNTTTGSSYTIPAQVSGVATTTLYLRAVQASTTNPAVCTPAIIGQTTAVNMGYSCNNPATCQPGNLATINATAIASGGTATNFTFDANGSAPITVRYDDVGRITLNASKTVTPFGGSTPVTLTGTSNPFVVAPHHFSFSVITSGLIKAGSPFSATVTAYNGLGTPTATPNFGKETTPEGVTLTSNLASGNNPALVNNVIAGGIFANGIATTNNLSWGEVGIITLTANLASGSYLGSGLTATGTSGNVGRHIPDHFDTVVTGGMPCPTGLTCPLLFNGFVYSGQPFTTNVVARNLAGVKTFNYDNGLGYSKTVTLTAWDAKGGAAQNPGSGTLGSNIVAATAFTSGAAAVTDTPTYTFATSPTTPTDIYVRAVDTDGATSLRATPSNSVEGGVKVVSGRVKIGNAHGSELLPLPMTATVQYYNGTNWTSSVTDSVTSLTLGVVSGSYQRKTGGTWTTTPTPAGGQVIAGVLPFKLSKPSSGGTGSVDVSISAPNYLLTGSNGAALDPSKPGRATFGVYKGSNEFIYLRETY